MTPAAASKLDAYFAKAGPWKEALGLLREIIREQPLTEEFKWRLPCYALEGQNVVILQNFKESCAAMFFNGTLLKDPKGILEAPGENSRAARRVMFRDAAQVKKLAPALRALLKQAVAAARAGERVDLKQAPAAEMPAELSSALASDAALRKAFEALTPGRQRAYVLHFAGAKQTATREARIEKCRAAILAGKGLNDR